MWKQDYVKIKQDLFRCFMLMWVRLMNNIVRLMMMCMVNQSRATYITTTTTIYRLCPVIPQDTFCHMTVIWAQSDKNNKFFHIFVVTTRKMKERILPLLYVLVRIDMSSYAIISSLEAQILDKLKYIDWG